MAGEWREFPLGELVEIFDGPHATPQKFDQGPIFLGISNLSDGRLDLSEVEHLSEQDYVRWTRRIEPGPGDVVFSYETRLGEAASIPIGLRCCLGRRMGLLRPRADRIDTRFLLYAYLGPQFQETLRAHTVPGSTVDRIPLIKMPTFSIVVPESINEQRAIAHILGTLDDKIKVNRRMSETLEAMARALFMSWFLSVNIERRRAVELIQGGVLEIGDGYRAKNSELGAHGLPFIRAANLRNSFDTESADRLRHDRLTKVGNKVSRVGDVAFTSKGTIGRLARVSEHTERFVYSPQVCFWRSLDGSRLHPAILYCWMQADDFVGQVVAVSGQTDMAPYVSLSDQRKMFVPDFPEEQQKIGLIIEPILTRASLAQAESRTLAALRDTLLPKLISGEIRVKDAERMVETAA